MARLDGRRDPHTACRRHPAHAPRRLPALRIFSTLTHRNAYAPQLHHIIRNCRETVNQRDPRGLTALHRAAFLAQYDGYLQIYEYLLVRARAATRRVRVASFASLSPTWRALLARRARAPTPPSFPMTTTRTCGPAATRLRTW